MGRARCSGSGNCTSKACTKKGARIAASRGPHRSKQSTYASLEIVKVLLDARANVNEAELVGCGETMS